MMQNAFSRQPVRGTRIWLASRAANVNVNVNVNFLPQFKLSLVKSIQQTVDTQSQTTSDARKPKAQGFKFCNLMNLYNGIESMAVHSHEGDWLRF